MEQVWRVGGRAFGAGFGFHHGEPIMTSETEWVRFCFQLSRTRTGQGMGLVRGRW